MSKLIPDMSDEIIQRFWSKVDRRSRDECWNWTASVKQGIGYGQFGIGGKSHIHSVHRVAYKLYYGVDPGDYFVLHTCDNRSCCNPHHLWLGTHTDNMQDMVRKERYTKTQPKLTGSKNAASKLTEAIVRKARALWTSGEIGCPQLAKKYGVSRTTMTLALKRKTWKHVT